ncbi:MAG: sigma-54 dependent transcriptional regulator [Acidobacteria bacterium]|jgi:DNA-binding NtrC family response regulator|nr:sigma-54 dependent transcriptional regulator [Acidobacteriota bacterium]
MKKILAIDDDQAVLNYLNILLLQTGAYKIATLVNSAKAFHELKASNYDLLLLDMDMPDVSGLDILRFIKEKGIDIETIVLTGVEDVELAVSAMKLGAFDYLTKPVDNDQLLKVITTVLETRKARGATAAEAHVSREQLQFREAFQDIITQNAEMIAMFQMVEKMAQPDNSILIWGESGTGKELIAKAIHRISRRRDENFVAVNAGTFANELFSSEFFGHDKGAFTGASAAKKGFLEAADRGTLFLDEIGELALPIQVKLLRVLQEGEFFRLGSTRNQKVDVRIIAATNKDLLSEMKKGNFRKDLFYRLNMSSVYLLPLRERKGDIPLLCQHFLAKYNEQNQKSIQKISDPALRLLNRYEYPGNVRELMNIINSAVIIESGTELHKKSLPHYFLESSAIQETTPSGRPLQTLNEMEKEQIRNVMAHTGGNKSQAAKILGISRVNLLAKIKKYQLPG